MLLEKIAIFIVFIGVLVFFHELGHFLFARLFGVRVETFSIGFGPKILKYKMGDTVYAISLIPLGGYVKMFGDDPFAGEELTEDEEKVAFNRKGKFARFCIVFGGPLANFILAFVLYTALFTVGEEYRPVQFGKVEEKSVLYQKGIRTADRIDRVNDKKFRGLESLSPDDSFVKSISVLRGDKEVFIALDMQIEDFFKLYGEAAPLFRKPIFVDTKNEEYIISNIGDYESLEHFLASSPEQITLKSQSSDKILTISNFNNDYLSKLRNDGFYPLDLKVDSIAMDSPALKMGVKSGDILTKLDDHKLNSFEDLRLKLQELKDNESAQLGFINQAGVEIVKEFTPQVKEIEGKKFKIIGVQRKRDIFIKPRPIQDDPKGFGESIALGFSRTANGINSVVMGFIKLFSSSNSFKSIGGPIAIGQVASEYFKVSVTKFLSLMALMSINLGVLNLFPIPVLDGGHILFIFVEVINGGPLSKKKMQVAMQIGFSFLIALTFLALFNDVSRLFS